MSSAVAVSFTLRGGDAVDLAERAHVHGRVERRHAGGVGQVRIGALLEQHRRGVVVRVPDRAHQRRRPFGIGGVDARRRASSSAAAASGAPSRAAYISAVQSPRGRIVEHAFEAEPILGERQRVRARIHVRAARQPAASPPPAWFSAAAHISAGLAELPLLRVRRWRRGRAAPSPPPGCRSAPPSSARVWPRDTAGLASAPFVEQRLVIAALPLTRRQRQRRHAVAVRGHSRLGAGAGCSARRQVRRRRPRTAQCSGVVPSASAALTSAGCFSSARTACRLPLPESASDRLGAGRRHRTPTRRRAATHEARHEAQRPRPQADDYAKKSSTRPLLSPKLSSCAAVLVGNRQPQVADRRPLASAARDGGPCRRRRRRRCTGSGSLACRWDCPCRRRR